MLSGVVATGAALAGARLSVIDATGQAVCTTQTDAAGTYRCELRGGSVAPLLVRASLDDLSLYGASVAKGGTANVTPLTTIVASRLSPDGDPGSLATLMRSRADLMTPENIGRQVTVINQALKPLIDKLGLKPGNPLTDAMVADGTGQDRLLDALNVTVRPDGSGANIDITVKTPDGSPASLRFRSGDAVVPTVPETVQVAEVPRPDVVAELFGRFNACFALPLTQRVRGASSDLGSAVGGPSDIVASICRQIFLNDDPSTFYSNGRGVGRAADGSGAWNSLFRGNATGLQQGPGTVEYFRPDGSMVISYRWTDAAGNSDFDTLLARNVGGRLKIVGNGNAYGAAVRAFAQHRDAINSPAFSNFSTGYYVDLPNLVDAKGNSLFAQVRVTTPDGSVLTYAPQAGLSYLTIVNPATGLPTSSATVRLRGEYESADTVGNPADKESSLYFVSPQFSDQQIAALGNQGIWTMEFFHADPAKANVTQTHRPLSRALTIGELRRQPMVRLSEALRAALVARSASNDGIKFGAPAGTNANVLDIRAPDGGDGWVVPDGALAPNSLTDYGYAPSSSVVPDQVGARFNDGVSLRSTQRAATISCSRQTLGDLHCDASSPTQYAAGALVNAVQLRAISARQVEYAKLTSLAKLQ